MDREVFLKKIKKLKIKQGDYILLNIRYVAKKVNTDKSLKNDIGIMETYARDVNGKEIMEEHFSEFPAKFIGTYEADGKQYLSAVNMEIPASQDVEEIISIAKLVVVRW